MNSSIKPRLLAALAGATLVALALFAPGASAQTPIIVFHHEPFATFEKQLAAGEVHSAEFNKKAHTLHLLMKNGLYDLTSYPPTEEPQIAAKLEAKGVPVSIEKSTKKAKAATHHKLRYIAGGILVLVIIVVTAVLLIDRRRKLAEGGLGRPADAPGEQ